MEETNGLSAACALGPRKLDLTQEDVAQKLGVTASAVSTWEAGRARPRLDKLTQLAELVCVTVSELMGEPPGQERSVRGTSALVPLLGWAHMGEPVDEGELHEVVEVPPRSPPRTPAPSASTPRATAWTTSTPPTRSCSSTPTWSP